MARYLALAAGSARIVAIVGSHIGTDQVMHVTGVFPPDGQAMFDPALNALALGGIGTVLSGLGFYATMNMNLGPSGIRWRWW